MSYLIVDAHQDLAWNMLTFGRDYTLPVQETRRREAAHPYIRENNGDTVLSWHEYQRGRVALVFATLFAAPLRARAGSGIRRSMPRPNRRAKLYLRQMDALRPPVRPSP